MVVRFLTVQLLLFVRRLLLEREDCVHCIDYQWLPHDRHGYDDDVADEIQLLVDGPPLVEPQIGERYETISGNDESIGLAYGEDSYAAGEGLSELLILWVVLESRRDLRKFKQTVRREFS